MRINVNSALEKIRQHYGHLKPERNIYLCSDRHCTSTSKIHLQISMAVEPGKGHRDPYADASDSRPFLSRPSRLDPADTVLWAPESDVLSSDRILDTCATLVQAWLPTMNQGLQSTPKDQAVRIFIGSGDASLLERKTLIYSIQKNTSRKLDIWHYNGTSNTIENETGVQQQCPKPPSLRGHRYATEFSLFRYFIPQLCNFCGKALYLDSDMVVLADIGELYDVPLQSCDFAACPDSYPGIAPDRWALSAMLIDCSVCRFDLDTIFTHIRQEHFSYAEFAQMGRRARNILPYRIKRLANVWNHFDRMDETTKLIHYTDLNRQPWKHRHHRYGEVWFEYFREAIRSGNITEQDIKTAIGKGFARTDIMKGNDGDNTALTKTLSLLHALRLTLQEIKRRAERVLTGANV